MIHDHTPQNRRNAILFLRVLMGITIVGAYAIGRPFLSMLIYSVILATVFYPVQQRLLGRTRSPGRAALISTGLLCLLIVVPLMIVLHMAASQAMEIAKEIEARSASEGGFVPFLTRHISQAERSVDKYVDLSHFDIQGQLEAKVKTIGAQLLPTAGMVLGNLVGSILNLFLGLLTVYVLLRDGDGIVNEVLLLLPLSEGHSRRLLQTLQDSVVANVQGVFAVGAAQGLGMALALAALGVSHATLLGILAAFCSVIPIFGTAVIWGPVAIQLLATGHVIKCLVLLGLGAGVISQLDNVIRPLFIGKRVQANALVLMIAILGGVNAFGFVGLFIGPMVVALIIAIHKMLLEEIGRNSAGDIRADAPS